MNEPEGHVRPEHHMAEGLVEGGNVACLRTRQCQGAVVQHRVGRTGRGDVSVCEISSK